MRTPAYVTPAIFISDLTVVPHMPIIRPTIRLKWLETSDLELNISDLRSRMSCFVAISVNAAKILLRSRSLGVNENGYLLGL